MFTKISELILTHIRNNRKCYFFLFVTFVVGISAGAFTVNGLSTVQNEDLANYLLGFMRLLEKQQVNNHELLQIATMENFKIVLILWLLGVTVIGIPFIFVVIGIRGFITGFSTGFLIKVLGFKGILFTLCSVVPREVLIIPCLIAIGVNGVNFSLNIIKNKSLKYIAKEGFRANIFSYCFVTAFYCVFIFTGVLIEAYISPVLIRLIAPIISV